MLTKFDRAVFMHRWPPLLKVKFPSIHNKFFFKCSILFDTIALVLSSGQLKFSSVYVSKKLSDCCGDLYENDKYRNFSILLLKPCHRKQENFEASL